MEDFILAMSACTPTEADTISQKLVESQLCACVNIVRGVTSIYRWKGKIQTDEECLLLMKTRKAHFDALQKKLKSLHSYEVPEFIAVPIAAGSAEYLKWVSDSVRK